VLNSTEAPRRFYSRSRLVQSCSPAMATVAKSKVVEDAASDKVESPHKDETGAPPPALPPRLPSPPSPSQQAASGRVPLPPPLPQRSVPERSTVISPPRNVKQRYRVADLQMSSTLGNASPAPILPTLSVDSRTFTLSTNHIFTS